MFSDCLRWRCRHLAAATLFFSRRICSFLSVAWVVAVVVWLLLLVVLLLAFLEIAGFGVALVCCVAGSVGCFAFELEVSFFVEVVVWYLGGFFGRCGFGCCGACFGRVVSTGGAWSRRLIRFWGHVHRVDCGRTQIKLVVGRILICESRHCVCEAEAGVQIACAEWRREVRGHDIGIAVGYSVAIRFPAKVHVDVLSVSISQQYLFFWPR